MAIAADIERKKQPKAAKAVLQWESLRAGNDPFPTYARLRREGGVTRVQFGDGSNGWLISRYDDVLALQKDDRITVDRSKAGYVPSALLEATKRFAGMDGAAMIMVDGAEHYRLRNLVHKSFTPRAIEKLDGQIRQLTGELLDEAAKKGTIDLIADFSLPLPLRVISEMLGVPQAESEEFHGMTIRLLDVTSASVIRALRAVPTLFTMKNYVGRLIDLKRAKPDDRLITQMVEAEEAGDRLSKQELTMMIQVLLFAGHETTVNLIANGMLSLLDEPSQFALLCAKPELAESAVEEMLRFSNPVEHGVWRYPVVDCEVGGVMIRRGEKLALLRASADRDEDVFPNADKFDITRQNNRHLGFGIGEHFCLGAALARLETKIAFEMIAKRFPNMRLAVPRDKIEWWTNGGLRGLKSLLVRLQ